MPPTTTWRLLDTEVTPWHPPKWGILLAKKWGNLNGQSQLSYLHSNLTPFFCVLHDTKKRVLPASRAFLRGHIWLQFFVFLVTLIPHIFSFSIFLLWLLSCRQNSSPGIPSCLTKKESGKPGSSPDSYHVSSIPLVLDLDPEYSCHLHRYTHF